MKAIILAAGEGSRLRPYTNDRPKCLVELGGKALLDWQLDALRANGITDIAIVRGYMAEKIERPGLPTYLNPVYDRTNMVYSLWCAKPELTDDVIISYADIVYEPAVVAALLRTAADLAVVVDKEWKTLWDLRMDDPLKDAETLRINQWGTITEIGQKPQSLEQIEAQYIGLMRFRGEGLAILKKIYERDKEIADRGGNPWNISRPFEKAFMTDFLTALITAGLFIKAVPISGGWFEIDSKEDYEMVRGHFADGTISRYFRT